MLPMADTSLVSYPGEIAVQHPNYELWSLILYGQTETTLTGSVAIQLITPNG